MARPQTIRSINELKVDPLQALRRALIHKGLLSMPRKSAAIGSVRREEGAALPTESVDEFPAEAPAEIKEESANIDKESKKAEEGPEEVLELAERAQEELFRAETIFPFTLVPDRITLDREKLTIAERVFWRVAKITSVPVSEILSCQVNVGPFFGSIHLVFSFFADNQRSIKFLWRDDAIELHRILHGYIIAHKRQINTTSMSTEDLKVLLKEIGQGAPD